MYDPARVAYRVEVEQDDTPLAGNVLASGDDVQDREAEEWVRSELDAGNDWAWGVVRVTAVHPGLPFVGKAYLGACSYASQEDFERGGYFEDMKAEALADLECQIAAVRAELCEGSAE